jgi:hypothetical protein
MEKKLQFNFLFQKQNSKFFRINSDFLGIERYKAKKFRNIKIKVKVLLLKQLKHKK